MKARTPPPISIECPRNGIHGGGTQDCVYEGRPTSAYASVLQDLCFVDCFVVAMSMSMLPYLFFFLVKYRAVRACSLQLDKENRATTVAPPNRSSGPVSRPPLWQISGARTTHANHLIGTKGYYTA